MLLCVWNGNKGVELFDLILGLSVLGVVSVMVLVTITRLSSPKKAKSKGDNSISDLYDVYNTQVKDILKIKDTQIASLTSKLKRLEAQDDEILTESNGKDITFEEITAIVQTKYPKVVPLLHLMKKQVMEATKGMSKEQILGYIGQFTGNQGSQVGISPESFEYNPNSA